MGALVRPRVLRFERCISCGAIVWRCRISRGIPMLIDPQPFAGGLFGVVHGGVLRPVDSDLIPRYTLHVWVCPEIKRRSRQRQLRRTLDWEVANAIAEARRPQPPQQLSLLPLVPPRRRRKEGWIDLTVGYHRGPPEPPNNGVIVLDVSEPPEPPRSN